MKKTVIICDNCGTQIEDGEAWTATVVHKRNRVNLTGDLCGDCVGNGAMLTNLPRKGLRGRRSATQIVAES